MYCKLKSEGFGDTDKVSFKLSGEVKVKILSATITKDREYHTTMTEIRANAFTEVFDSFPVSASKDVVKELLADIKPYVGKIDILPIIEFINKIPVRDA